MPSRGPWTSGSRAASLPSPGRRRASARPCRATAPCQPASGARRAGRAEDGRLLLAPIPLLRLLLAPAPLLR
eukprot:15463877-Alexandrium_andersonii.AAC.1